MGWTANFKPMAVRADFVRDLIERYAISSAPHPELRQLLSEIVDEDGQTALEIAERGNRMWHPECYR